MSAAPIRRLLVDAGVVSPFAYASGFPAILPYGHALVCAIHDVYVNQLSRTRRVGVLCPPIAFDATSYRDAFAATFDYANVYRAAIAGQDVAIRPDSLPWLVAQANGWPTDHALVSHAPLFRAETADPQPLLRDRHIWGATQVVDIASKGDLDDVVSAHVAALVGLHSALLLPVLVVEAPPLRRHARRRLLSFTGTRDGKLWLTSTLYVLADELARSVGARAPVVEFGYTAKLLALSASLHADDVGLRVPGAIASPRIPVMMRSAGDRALAERAVASLEHAALVEGPHSRAMRDLRRCGSPAGLLIDGERSHQLYRRVDDWTFVITPEAWSTALADAISAHDEALWDQAVAAQEPLGLGDGDGWIAPADHSDETTWFSLGHVTAANFDAGQTAADAGLALLSRLRRLY
jgi:hypothetical protein